MRFIAGHQRRGKRWTPEQHERFRETATGHEVTPQTRRKISQNHKAKGVRPSIEACIKGILNQGTGADHPSWKGGITLANGRKCIYRPGHPRAHRSGYVYEHILVAEEALGRPILPTEVVHHIDRDKANNAPENLMVLPSQAEHMRLHKIEGY